MDINNFRADGKREAVLINMNLKVDQKAVVNPGQLLFLYGKKPPFENGYFSELIDQIYLLLLPAVLYVVPCHAIKTRNVTESTGEENTREKML